MNNFCSSSNKVSTHYITWLFSFWIWRRRCLKFAWFWPYGALPLGPHGGHTYYLNNFESPTPKDDSCQVWLKFNHAFSRRRWKCKKFTDDGRRTTHDARKRTAIAHSSLRLGWAKNINHKGHLHLLANFATLEKSRHFGASCLATTHKHSRNIARKIASRSAIFLKCREVSSEVSQCKC